MKENGKCRLLMGAYFIVVCIILGYAAYYLESGGFSPWATGVIVSGSSFAGGLLQAAAGRLADRNPAWPWKRQLEVYCILALVVAARWIIVRNHIWDGISLGLIIVIVMVMMPLVNTACFYYTDREIKVDFGIARGIGSVSFATASFVLGRLTAAKGAGVIPVCAGAAFAVLLAAVLIMPYYGPAVKENKERARDGAKGFAAKYPMFIVMASGITLALVFHNIINTYLINIMEEAGGHSGNLGTALAIAAAVELPVLFLYSRIEGRRGLTAAALISAGCFFFALRGLLFMAATGVLMIYFIQLLQSFSYGLVTAAKASYAHQTVAADDDTTAQSVMSMTDSFGTVAGSLSGGFLLSAGGTSLMLAAGTAMAAAGTIITFAAARSGSTGGKVR